MIDLIIIIALIAIGYIAIQIFWFFIFPRLIFPIKKCKGVKK